MNYTIVTHVRLTPQMEKALQTYAAENETQPASIIRLAVKEFLISRGVDIPKNEYNSVDRPKKHIER